MSSDSMDKDLSLALRKIDEAWRAVARCEVKRKAAAPIPRRARLPAASAAWMLDIAYHADGAAWVRINEEHEFTLPPKLARFLELLAADGDRCPDGTVDWKSVSHLRAAMTTEFGEPPVAPHALNQLAYRLRDELGRHGVHPGLVQYHRTKKAFRFALRPA